MEDDDVLHELVEKIEHLQAARYYIVAPVVILYFDWFLTFSLEVDRFWKRKCTGPTVLFFINRYFALLAFIPIMVAYFSDTMTPTVCAQRIVPFVVAANVVNQCIIAIVLALRTYALYQQDRVILLVVSLAWAGASAVGAWGASAVTLLEVPFEVHGCLLHVPDRLKYRLAIAYGGSLAFDTLIYGLTLWKTYSLRRTRYSMKLPGDTLLERIFRDGSIYFFVLLGANTLSILLICIAEPDLRVINVTFTHIIPVTITSRLLLNLRNDVRKNRRSVHLDTTQSTSFGNSDFLDMVLGNIGETFMESDDTSNNSKETNTWSTGYYSGYAGEEIALQSIEVPELRFGRTNDRRLDDADSRGF